MRRHHLAQGVLLLLGRQVMVLQVVGVEVEVMLVLVEVVVEGVAVLELELVRDRRASRRALAGRRVFVLRHADDRWPLRSCRCLRFQSIRFSLFRGYLEARSSLAAHFTPA